MHIEIPTTAASESVKKYTNATQIIIKKEKEFFLFRFKRYEEQMIDFDRVAITNTNKANEEKTGLNASFNFNTYAKQYAVQ